MSYCRHHDAYTVRAEVVVSDGNEPRVLMSSKAALGPFDGADGALAVSQEMLSRVLAAIAELR